MASNFRADWQDFLGFTREEIAPVSPIRAGVSRDGQTEPFNVERIRETLAKTVDGVRGHSDPELVLHLTNLVTRRLLDRQADRHPSTVPGVEEIQDLIETILIEEAQVDLAKQFILYRAKHAAVRDAKKLMLNITETMEGYLSGSDWRVKENANVNFSLGGLILHNSGTLTANYWLKNVYPEAIAEAHQNADFHLHDLSMFSGYCAGWSLRQVIVEGLERGTLVLPVSELEAGLEDVERRLAELADDTRVSAADDDGPVVLPDLATPRPAELARRRGSRPMEMG